MSILAQVTRYDRRDHGGGVVSWVYDYWNRAPIVHGGLAAGLELGVQLEGEWLHEGAFGGRALVGPGRAHHLNVGERYSVRFDGAATPGVQVGFAIYPREMDEYRALDEELSFQSSSHEIDAPLFALCRALAADRDLPSSDVRREVRAYLERRCELGRPEPLLVAKRELETYFDRELCIRHIAEAANMHPVTFARKFKARFGTSPVTYRRYWRLNHAGRLLWSRHDLSIEEVAEQTGHSDMPYFYRSFRRMFGDTPAGYRARAVKFVQLPAPVAHVTPCAHTRR